MAERCMKRVWNKKYKRWGYCMRKKGHSIVFGCKE